MTFELGTVLMTPGIRNLIDSCPEGYNTVIECINRHAKEDWGDLCDEDRQMNDDALIAEKRPISSDSMTPLCFMLDTIH